MSKNFAVALYVLNLNNVTYNTNDLGKKPNSFVTKNDLIKCTPAEGYAVDTTSLSKYGTYDYVVEDDISFYKKKTDVYIQAYITDAIKYVSSGNVELKYHISASNGGAPQTLKITLKTEVSSGCITGDSNSKTGTLTKNLNPNTTSLDDSVIIYNASGYNCVHICISNVEIANNEAQDEDYVYTYSPYFDDWHIDKIE